MLDRSLVFCIISYLTKEDNIKFSFWCNVIINHLTSGLELIGNRVSILILILLIVGTADNILILRKSLKGIKDKTHSIANLLRGIPSTLHSISHIEILCKIIEIINYNVLERRLLQHIYEFCYHCKPIKTCKTIYLDPVTCTKGICICKFLCRLTYILYSNVTLNQFEVRVRNTPTNTLNNISFLWVKTFNA